MGFDVRCSCCGYEWHTIYKMLRKVKNTQEFIAKQSVGGNCGVLCPSDFILCFFFFNSWPYLAPHESWSSTKSYLCINTIKKMLNYVGDIYYIYTLSNLVGHLPTILQN